MEILKICLEEQLLTKYYVINHLILLKIQNMMDINMNLPQWFINFLIGSIRVVLLHTQIIPLFKSKIMTNQQLAEDLHKSVIRKLEKPKVYSSFKDNIWGVDLGDI